MTLETWSVRERQQLTSLLRKVESMHHKSINLSRDFGDDWPSEISSPLKNVTIALAEAAYAIYRERGRK